MTRIVSYALMLFAISLSSIAAAKDPVTVFVNVNVIPMSSDVVYPSQTVVVAGGKIKTVGNVDDVPVPKGATIIDGTDRFLMPGLAEMHAHVTSTDPQQFDRLATLFVANGITTIRGMLGRPSHLELRRQLAAEEVFGPRLVTSGPSVNGSSISSAAAARKFVRAQKEAGYDFIKVHPGPTAAEFTAMAEEANQRDMPFAGHVPAAVDVEVALGLGMTTIDHLDGYFRALLPATSSESGGFFNVMLAGELEVDRIPAIAAATASAGTWNVPTQTLIEQLIDSTTTTELKQRPEMRYVARSTVNEWVSRKEATLAAENYDADIATLAIDTRRQLILELHRANAGLLLGSDAPQIFNVPGFSTHRELVALVDAGLTPYEALRTGTVAVAEFLQSPTGVVAEGRAADLLLLDANPLIDIGNSERIHGVMLRGRWYSKSALESRLAQYDRTATR